MEDYHFQVGELPAEIQRPEKFLFNQHPHRVLQSPGGWKSYYILHAKRARCVGTFHILVNNHSAVSPGRAPFGGFEMEPGLPSAVVYRFLEFIEADLRSFQVEKIAIRNPPVAYQPEVAALINPMLMNVGYRIAEAEIGSVLFTSHEFANHLDPWEKRKFRQAQEAGLSIRKVSLEHIDAYYFFILSCRKRKNYGLSMTLADVRRATEEFADRYLLFGVYQGDTLVAASLSVLVSESILYNFYCDHDEKFDALSPIVFLVGGLHQYGMAHGISILDLGTSALQGKPNFSLLDFKRRLGGVPTPKLTFEKILR